MDATATGVFSDVRTNVNGDISTDISIHNRTDEKEMKRWLTIILLLVWVGIAGAQATPTATPTPVTPPMCSITGNVANADGSPYIGVIKFYNPIVQIINNIPINPLQVSTGTTPTGVINPISLPQGAFFQVTMCPSASASSGCAATFTAIVPAAPTANFGNMAMGTNLINPSIITSSLSVSGPSSFSGTMSFPDGSTYDTNGHENMKALGIGASAPTQPGGLLQATSNGNYATTITLANNNAGTSAQSVLYFNNNLTASTNSYGAVALVSSGFTAGGSLIGGDSFDIETSGSGGMVLSSGATSGAAPIAFDVGGVPQVVISGQGQPQHKTGLWILGGSVGGWSQLFMDGGGLLSGYNESMNVVAGAHYDGVLNNWVADQTTANLIQMGGDQINFYTDTALTVGNTYTPTLIMWMGTTALNITHMQNNQNASAPTVTGGTLQSGSRDSFGEIVTTNAANPIVMTYGKAFVGNSVCTTADDGQANLWYPFNKSGSGVSFQCYTWGGVACSGTQDLVYHCFGMGG